MEINTTLKNEISITCNLALWIWCFFATNARTKVIRVNLIITNKNS